MLVYYSKAHRHWEENHARVTSIATPTYSPKIEPARDVENTHIIYTESLLNTPPRRYGGGDSLLLMRELGYWGHAAPAAFLP